MSAKVASYLAAHEDFHNASDEFDRVFAAQRMRELETYMSEAEMRDALEALHPTHEPHAA